MDVMDPNIKAHRAQCSERGPESDRSGKESSKRFPFWDMGKGAVPGKEIT